jgi:hypothetical protein
VLSGGSEQEGFCFVESRDGRYASDGGKAFEEVFECFAALEVVE